MKRRRIHRKEFTAAMTELVEFLEAAVQSHDGEFGAAEFCFADAPQFSLTEFLKKYLGTSYNVNCFRIKVPDALRVLMDVGKQWPSRASIEPSVSASLRLLGDWLSAEVYGFQETETHYELDVRWHGREIPIPISISKPNR